MTACFQELKHFQCAIPVLGFNLQVQNMHLCARIVRSNVEKCTTNAIFYGL